MAQRPPRPPASEEAADPFSSPTREVDASPFKRVTTRSSPRPITGMMQRVPESFDVTTDLLPMEQLWPKEVQAAPQPVAIGPVGFGEDTTAPGLAPAPVVVTEARAAKRGEIGQLLLAIPPFLWSLEEAERWARALAQDGDTNAAVHARSLGLLAKILGQLQSRIDELAKLE